MRLRTALILMVLMITVSISGTVLSFAAENLECTYIPGYNVNRNNYDRWAMTTKSYLTKRYGQDGYMRVQAVSRDGVVYIVYYDKDFKLIERKQLEEELPLFGAFYESDDSYYIVTGQYNHEEDDSKEVIRVTKYDKNWVRQGSCSIYGQYIYNPFAAGSCKIDISGIHMVIRTAYEQYKTSDGLHHQSSMNILVDTREMTARYSGFGVISHSFNQFIQIDGLDVYTVDHGDAYPRSIVLQKSPFNTSTGFVNTTQEGLNIMTFPGETGENETGASIGGFEFNNDAFLIAGNSVVQDERNTERTTRNIFLASVDKGEAIEDSEVNVNWLTDFDEGEETARTPYLIKVQKRTFLTPGSRDRYMMLWTRGKKLYYVFVDSKGSLDSEIYEKDGALSDCVPVVIDNVVTWYTWLDADEVFYQIPLDDPDGLTWTHANYDHDYQWTGTSDGLATFECTKCGAIKTGKAPTSFITWWRHSESTDDNYYGRVVDIIDEGDTVLYMISDIKYSAESENTAGGFVVESDDPENCVVDMSRRTLTFLKAGKYQITVYPKYNPEAKVTYTLKAVKKLESVSLSGSPASPAEIGYPVELTAVPEGGRSAIKYTFDAVTPGGKSVVLQEASYYDSCTWKPDESGTWALAVTAEDISDGTVVTSSKIQYVIKEKEAGGSGDESGGDGDGSGSGDGAGPGDGSGSGDGSNGGGGSGSGDGGGSDSGSGSGESGDSGCGSDSGESGSGGKDGSSSQSGGKTPDKGLSPSDPSKQDRAAQNGEDGTSFGRGASIEAAEEALAKMTSDSDPAGSKFSVLMAKSTRQKKSSIKLTWKKVPGAKGYIIYANKCGKKNRLTKLAAAGASVKSFTVKEAAGKKLKKGTYYKFMVIAIDGDNNVVTASKIIHVATAGGKVGNHKKIKIAKSILRKAKKLKVGKTLKIRVRAIPASKKYKVKKHVAVRYESSNPEIVTVNKKGVARRLKRGKAMIYAYAQNGVSKKVG